MTAAEAPPWTATAIAAAVGRGDVTAVEVLDEALARIDRLDPALNAVVLLVPERARAAAGEVDRGDRRSGPLAGVPLLVKDLHAEVVGIPLARGSRRFAGTTVDRSSVLVERLEAAGAVIVGRTNSPELGLNITTEPELWGPCRNPYDHTRSAGGSSGGSAAAVAAGMVPAAHASDSGGSIRIPAAWCGLVGLKPTRGLVPCGPHRRNPWDGLSHEHALTTTVADSRLLLEVGSDRTFPPPPHRPLRIGLIDQAPSGVAIDPACGAALDRAVDVLLDAGHEIRPLGYPPVAGTLGAVIAPVIAGHLALACRTPDGRFDLDGLEPAIAELTERGVAMSAADHLAARDTMLDAAASVETALDGVDLVLSPTTAATAPTIGTLRTDRPVGELFDAIFSLSPYTVLYNVTGRPAISVPAGLDGGGVPVGVQLGGRAGDDALLLTVADRLLDGLGGGPRP